MSPLNNSMNYVDGLGQNVNPQTNQAQGFVKKNFATRITTVVVGVPLEICAVARNVFVGAVEGAAIPLRLLLNTFKIITRSDYFAKIDDKIPTLDNFFKTVYRIVAYTIGVFSTLTLGVISPALNFKLHCAAGLAVNERLRNIQILNELRDLETQKALDEAAALLQLEMAQAAEQEKAKLIEEEKLALEVAKKAAEAAIEQAAAEAVKKLEQDKPVVVEIVESSQPTSSEIGTSVEFDPEFRFEVPVQKQGLLEPLKFWKWFSKAESVNVA